MRSLLTLAVLTATLSTSPSFAAPAAVTNSPATLSKVVLQHEDGTDRHWLIKSNALIIEEHYLTGDLHVMVRYPNGVRTPQVDAPPKDLDANVESIATVFWSNGKRMSLTPMIGGKPNGQDFVWWPGGQLAREAHFAMGDPTGVWKFYDQQGKSVGEGTFKNGKPADGIFIGEDSAGGDFFLTDYPIRKKRYENGVVKEREVFLRRLNMQ